MARNTRNAQSGESAVDFVVECGFMDVVVRRERSSGLVVRVELHPSGSGSGLGINAPSSAEDAELSAEDAEFVSGGVGVELKKRLLAGEACFSATEPV